jgi:ribonuclease HI
MTLRDKRVLARCDDAGQLVAQGGRVEIRYSPRDGKAYHASVRNLEPIAGELGLLPDDHCAPVSAPAKAGATGSGAAKKTARGGGRAAAGGGAPPSRPAPGEVLAYCDGACSGNPGPAGVGVVLLYDDQRWELSEFLGTGTNNIGELMGILRACEQTPDPKRPLRIYTDSTYSIGVLQKGWKAKANVELVAACKAALARLEDVSLFYVKGHAGIPLNEVADTLAVAAVERRASRAWTKVG